MGKMNIVTLDRDYQVNAWAPFRFGGSYSLTSDELPACESVCAITGAQGYNDTVFFLVTRTIDGSTVTYLEQLQEFFEYEEIDSYLARVPFYMDCLKYQVQASSTTVSGLDHLEGETVQVMADGLWVTNAVVTGGQITLATAATVVLVGIKYTSILRPSPIEQGSQTGSPVGKFKRVHDVYIRFYNSKHATYGKPDGTMYQINMSTPTALDMFSGDVPYKFPPGVERRHRVEVQCDAPYPCNVLSIAMEGVTYD
jgi:hypothetical protein